LVQAVSSEVLNLKIVLLDIQPPIWRRVLVPANFTLAKLHGVIQIAFGWEDYHLHSFHIHGVEFGQPDPGGWTDYKSERIALAELDLKPKFRYEYDFGDSWIHEIRVGRVMVPKDPVMVPVCLEGERACPPEDCGGVWGYQEMLEALSDPADPRHDEFKEWLVDDWDSESFNLTKVNASLEEAFKPRKRAIIGKVSK